MSEPVTCNDPQSPLCWLDKSVRKLSEELKRMEHHSNHALVTELRQQLGYGLQAFQKTLEGADHLDRETQLEHIDAKVKSCQALDQPATSVDNKKKELICVFHNSDLELCSKCSPKKVRVHDFLIPEFVTEHRSPVSST